MNQLLGLYGVKTIKQTWNIAVGSSSTVHRMHALTEYVSKLMLLTGSGYRMEDEQMRLKHRCHRIETNTTQSYSFKTDWPWDTRLQCTACLHHTRPPPPGLWLLAANCFMFPLSRLSFSFLPIFRSSVSFSSSRACFSVASSDSLHSFILPSRSSWLSSNPKGPRPYTKQNSWYFSCVIK
jgi:hypothetical protein